jgi:hypothetical protein
VRTFPGATVGIPATKDLKITNVAQSGALTITSTSISGPDAKMFGERFQDGTAVVVQPGQSTTIPVVFLATAAVLQLGSAG